MEQRREFQERLLRRVSELPGVERVALASSLPIDAGHAAEGVTIEGRPAPPAGQEPLAYIIFASPGLYETLGIRLIEGRLFSSAIGYKDPPVAVINETMARRFWPNESALGKRIRSNDPDDHDWYEVIGVVRDVTYPGHFGALDTRLQVYRPMVRVSWNNFIVAVRAAAPASLTETLRRTVAGLDGDLPVAYPRTVEQALEYAQHNFQVVNHILGAFAILGLLLAAVGLYSVVSGIVVQRTQEFGVRMALGARAHDILWLVLSKGVLLATLGILPGLAGAAGLWHVLGAIIPGLPGQDLLTLTLLAALLFVVTLAACLLPACRAAKVDPLVSLRHE